MKLKLTLLLVFMAVFAGIKAQQLTTAQVPQAVLDAFAERYPNAAEVEWEKDSTGIYEAEFEIDKVEHEAIFTENGQWLETEIEIAKKDLPEAVTKAFKEKFNKKNIKAATRIESYKRGILYELSYRSGLKRKTVLFDSGGELVE